MSNEGNPVSLFHLHLIVFLSSVFLSTLHPEVGLRTICSVGRKQGSLPWKISLTVYVYIRHLRYPITGWSAFHSKLFAHRPPLRPIVLGISQTRIRLASPVSRLVRPIRPGCRSVSRTYSGSRCVEIFSEYSECCLSVVLPPSISSTLNPPEFYPGHGHQM